MTIAARVLQLAGTLVVAAALAGCPDEPARSPDDEAPSPTAQYTPPPPNYEDPAPGTFVHGKPSPGDPSRTQTPPPAPSGAPKAGPMLVDIALMDATISPGKVDRVQWDGTGFVPPEIMRDLGVALEGKDPYTSIVALLAKPQVAKLDKPEPVGWAELYGDPRGVKRIMLEQLPGQRATYTPQWTEAARWTRVPLTRDIRLRVNLIDQDEIVADLIGVCEVSYEAIVKALEKGGGHRVQVSEQTRRQVLFLGFTVTPSR